MIEQHPPYHVIRKDLGGIRSETLVAFDQDWQQPASNEVRALIQYLGRCAGKDKLTGLEVANLAGVNPRNVRKWTAPEDTSNYVRIPYAAWRLLLLHAGVVQLQTLDQCAAEPNLED